MKCPYCSSDEDHVIDSRLTGDGSVVRRRRECKKCDKRYTTYERIELRNTPIKVIKNRENIRENFSREKLQKSIDVVCHKLDVPQGTIESMTEEIAKEIEIKFDSEVHFYTIAEMVMTRLEKVNKTAYIRYASAYQDFENMADFLKDLLPFFESQVEGEEGDDESEDGDAPPTHKKESKRPSRSSPSVQSQGEKHD